MTKQDLKTGMLVQIRDGSIGLIVNRIVLYGHTNRDSWGWDKFSEINDALVWPGGTEIVRVSQILKDNLLLPIHWTAETVDKYLLWSRDSGFVVNKTSTKPLRKEQFDIESNTWTETK